MGHAPPRPKPDKLTTVGGWPRGPRRLDPPAVVSLFLAVAVTLAMFALPDPIAALVGVPLLAVAAVLGLMPRAKAKPKPEPKPYLPSSVDAGSMAARAVEDYMRADGDWIDLELRLDELVKAGTYDDPAEIPAWKIGPPSWARESAEAHGCSCPVCVAKYENGASPIGIITGPTRLSPRAARRLREDFYRPYGARSDEPLFETPEMEDLPG